MRFIEDNKEERPFVVKQNKLNQCLSYIRTTLEISYLSKHGDHHGCIQDDVSTHLTSQQIEYGRWSTSSVLQEQDALGDYSATFFKISSRSFLNNCE